LIFSGVSLGLVGLIASWASWIFFFFDLKRISS
jgi:hypothetical protein